MAKKVKENAHIIDLRDAALDDLKIHDPSGKEYTQIVENAVSLTEMAKSHDTKPNQIKPDTWLLVGVSAFALVTTLVFEQSGHVITSKTWSAVSKILQPRL